MKDLESHDSTNKVLPEEETRQVAPQASTVRSRVITVVTLLFALALSLCSCCHHVFRPSTTLEILPSTEMSLIQDNEHGLMKPIPPFHPHHQGQVTYSSTMKSDGSIVYRRDINAPCDYGMLLFNIGPAHDNLPYQYDVYDDAYLFSDNNGLCVFYPSYNGYQTAPFPFWKAMDPMKIIIKPLNTHTMHRISSRVVPVGSTKKVDPKITGDYIIIAKHDYYNPHFYQNLKAKVNSWTADGDWEEQLAMLTTMDM